MAEGSRWRATGWVALALALLGIVAWPLFRLLSTAWGAGLGGLAAAIGTDGAAAVATSLWMAIVVTVASVAGGTALALLTERSAVPGVAWLRAGILAPLLIPDFVTAISWTRAYGPVGITARLTGVELPGLYGPVGIVVVLVAGAVPLAYLVVAAGLRVRSEPDLERAARASGATPWESLRQVTLPLLLPVLGAAAALVFVTTMNAFGTPVVLGRPAGVVTMTTRIYQDLAFSSTPEAFARVVALSALLVLLAVVTVAVAGRALAIRGERTGASAGPVAAHAPASRAGTGAAWAFVVLTVLLPLLALVLTAMTRAVGLTPLPPNLTLAHFAAALDARTVASLGTSLVLAALTAIGAVLLGGLATAVASRRGSGPVGMMVLLTFALPGSVVAVAILIAYGVTLRDTLAILLVAYLAKLWALGQRPVAAAVSRLPADLARAARVHGAGSFTTLRTVVLPLLAPAIVAAGLLVFTVAINEVTISTLLYGPHATTLAVSIVNLQQLGDPTVTAALAVVLTAIVGLAALGLLLLRRVPWGAAGVGLG